MAAKTPYRLVLDDWSAGVKGASQTIYFDNPQPDILWDDAMLAAQTGPVPYCQSSQSFIHGTGGYKFEFGVHRFELPASCNDEANEPVYQTLIAFTPKDRWSGYPSMVGYDQAADSTIPKPFRITVYNEDGSVHHIFEMYRDGLPINDPSLGQTRNLTTRWRPFTDTAQMLYHCSHRLKMSSDARKYCGGTRAQYWHRPTISKSRAFSNMSNMAFGTRGQQPNGYGQFLLMPEWSANTSDADWNADPKTDATVAWNNGNDPSGNNTDGSRYPSHAMGWRHEPGSMNAGHEKRSGPGGMRFARFPVPSQLMYLMTEPDGVRMQGNVPWRTLWDEYAAGFFNLSYHHVQDAKTLSMWSFADVSSGQKGYFNSYYYNNKPYPGDPENWIDQFGLENGWYEWRDYVFDLDGRFKYGTYTSDNQHAYDVPAWHTTHFNSLAHAISQKLRYYAMIMSWNRYFASPTADMSADSGEGPQVFQRQHAWRWEQMAFLWKTAGSGPLVPRADVEALWKLHLEAMHDQIVEPATNPAHAKYGQPLFEGLRNLGMPVQKVTSGSNHYYRLVNDDKKFYFFGVVTIMRTLGCFDRLRQLSAKCAAALDFVVACYAKGGAERMVATKARQEYGAITPTVPTTTPLTMPANWAAVAAAMQPQDNSDMVRNADGSPFRGGTNTPEGNYNNRERWLYQHLLQQTCYALKDHFADYPNSAVATAAAMSDEFEQFALADIQSGQKEWGQRFIAAGPMLAEASSVTQPEEPAPADPVQIMGGPFASTPFGAPYLQQADTVDLTGAACVQGNSSQVGSVTRVHSVVGASCSQGNASSTGVLQQGSILTAATATQVNLSQTGAVTQTHAIVGATCAQSADAVEGAVAISHNLVPAPCLGQGTVATAEVSQVHRLSGASATQASSILQGAVSQEHALQAASSTQVNISFVGSLQGAAQFLAGAPSSQPNGSAGAAISQAQMLAGAGTTATGVSGVGAIGQAHRVAGVVSVSRSVSGSAAVTQEQVLVGSSTAQSSTSELGRIVVAFNLAAQAAQVSSACSTGAVSVSHALGSTDCIQRNPSLGSGVTCIQQLLGLDVGQINLSPSASLAGRVAIINAPPGQTFRLVADSTVGAQETW